MLQFLRSRRASVARGIFERIFARHSIHPVLIDVGASGAPPDIWRNIARWATYVGFDPDRRELDAESARGFRSSFIIPKAVSADERGSTRFYLTESPYCSSTLPPNHECLKHYRMHPLFSVEDVVEVQTTTLSATLRELQLQRVDWIKLDTQGQDLALFDSLESEVRDGVLAVEMEPGLVDAYQGEDVFVEIHPRMLGSGYWLATMSSYGSQRVKLDAVARLRAAGVDDDMVRRWSSDAPAWVEVRYLRTVEHLEKHDASLDRFILLWTIAMETGHPAFALEVGEACARHDAPEVARELASCTSRIMRTGAALRKARQAVARRLSIT